MKKMLSLLLIALLVLSCMACQKDTSVEYTIYYSGVDGIDEETARQELTLSATEYNLKDFDQLDWYNSGAKVDDSESKEQFEIELNGITIQGQLVETIRLEMADVENLKDFGTVCTYVNYEEGHNPRELFEIRRETGELIKFQNIFDMNVSGQCTSDQAKEIADKLVSEMFDEKYMSEYSYASTELQTGTAQSPKKYYRVRYTRDLYGHEIDNVSVQVNMAGDIVGIYACDLGKYYNIEKRISQNAVERAYDVLMDLDGVKDRKTSSETVVLRIAGDGKLYMMSLIAPASSFSILTINVE